MTGFWVVWYATVQAVTTRRPDLHLDRAVEELRHHHYVFGADHEYDPAALTVAFGVRVEAATRIAAISRAGKAIRDSMRRADLGAPYPRRYGPRPALRLELEPMPHSARPLQEYRAPIVEA